MSHKPTVAQESSLTKSVLGQLIMLTLQFLLGMAINLMGEPESAFAKASHGLLLGLHILIAVGLVINASLIMHHALKLGGHYLRTARFATAGIGTGFLAGILTLVTQNDWWSYLMAIGFIDAFVFSGILFVQLKIKP
jgi:hypothetical protein